MKYRVVCGWSTLDSFEADNDNEAAGELIKHANAGVYGQNVYDPIVWNLIELLRIDQEEVTTPISKTYDDGSDNQ